MAASLGELFIELGVFADTKELKDFEDKLRKVAKTTNETKDKTKKFNNELASAFKTLRTASLAIAGAIFALNKLTDSLVQSNQEYLNLTRNSDIALGTFQKWNNVGRLFGVKNAAQQIAGLNKRLFELKLTGQGAEGFMLAGINPVGKDANGVMEALRSRVAGLNDTSATYLLEKMGLDPSMLHLLRLSRKEFEELNATTSKYRLSEEQTKQIQAMNMQLEIARIKFQYLKDRAVMGIMPHFVKLIKLFVSAAEGIKAIVGIVVKAINSLPTLAKNILTVAAALGVLKKALMLNPLMAKLSMLFGAIALIADDINHYMNGGGSVIGVIAKTLEDFQENGFFSDDVPLWIQMLVRGADTLLKAYNAWKERQEYLDWKKIKDNDILKPLTPEEIEKLQAKFGRDYIDKTLSNPYIPGSTGVTNNVTNAPQLTMNNTINTTQTGQIIGNELAYAQNVAYSLFA